MSSQLVVNHAPEVVERKVSATRLSLTLRLILSGVGYLLAGAFYLWRGDRMPAELVAVLVASVCVSGIGAGVQLWWFYRRRSERKVTGTGPALIMSPDGVQTVEGAITWDDLERLRAIRGAKRGYGHRLEAVDQHGRSLTAPLDALEMLPGTLDAAARAYSYGRHGLDLTVLED